MKLLRRTTTLLLALLITATVRADLLVLSVKEKELPYDLSPTRYELSPRNYDNSPRNYENSATNYKNSSTNYENSSSNFKNSINGDRSILVEEDGKFLHLGYYVLNEEGVTNFYSPKGTRLFYNPKGNEGLYHSTSGAFCGVIARFKGKTRLALTEVGIKALYLKQ